jgi:ATPase subunit of ABC transporter with duplicated ATPase domains
LISVQNFEIRIGARTLMSDVNFRVQRGDKIGLVGRNGAGKTTMTKILAGVGRPTQGTVTRSGEIGHLPEDPCSGDPEELAMRSKPLGKYLHSCHLRNRVYQSPLTSFG